MFHCNERFVVSRDLSECIEHVWLQLKQIINSRLVSTGSGEMDQATEESLHTQVQLLTNRDSPIRSLMSMFLWIHVVSIAIIYKLLFRSSPIRIRQTSNVREECSPTAGFQWIRRRTLHVPVVPTHNVVQLFGVWRVLPQGADWCFRQ